MGNRLDAEMKVLIQDSLLSLSLPPRSLDQRDQPLSGGEACEMALLMVWPFHAIRLGKDLARKRRQAEWGPSFF